MPVISSGGKPVIRLNYIDDSKWEEVKFINGYAVFLGYLLMGVRGMGFLVFTWSTVVLLGGFVSMLEKKDFICLTLITLIQAAGVFDFLVSETLRDVGDSGWGLLAGVWSIIVTKTSAQDKRMSVQLRAHGLFTEDKKSSGGRRALAYGLFAVQLLVFAFLLCPLAVLYMLGLYISAGISTWRLVEHDYGSVSGAKLKTPALQVLYSLAVAQGILFGYRAIYAFGARSRIAQEVADWYKLDPHIVLEYLNETARGCKSNPSFARGRNLVTYAVDLLLKSKSHQTYLYGIRILGTLIRSDKSRFGMSVLIKQLLTGSSSKSSSLFIHTVQRLLETLGPRSPCSSEIREHAARIVAHIGGSIHLEQFPQGTDQYISSLLETLEEYNWRPEGYERDTSLPTEYERDWLLEEEDERLYLIYEHESPERSFEVSPTGSSNDPHPLHGWEGLVVQGLRILQKLVVDDNNCRVLSSNTQGLVSKAMAPLISVQLHRESHDEWSNIAEESLELISRVMAAPRETRAKLRGEISVNKEAVTSTLETIVECCECEVLLKRQAVEILLELSPPDTISSSITATTVSSSRIFIWMLLHIFLLTDRCFDKMCGSTHLMKKSIYFGKLAGDKLQALLASQCGGSCTGAALGDLTRTLLAHTENNKNRLYAAEILGHLYHYCIKDDKYLVELKKSITEVVPQVLREILGCGSTGEELAPGIDLEKGGDSQADNDQENSSPSHQQIGEQHNGSELQEALISLCIGIWLNSRYDDQINGIAARICSEQNKPVVDFYDLVEEARELLKKKKAQELTNIQASSLGKT